MNDLLLAGAACFAALFEHCKSVVIEIRKPLIRRHLPGVGLFIVDIRNIYLGVRETRVGHRAIGLQRSVQIRLCHAEQSVTPEIERFGRNGFIIQEALRIRLFGAVFKRAIGSYHLFAGIAAFIIRERFDLPDFDKGFFCAGVIQGLVVNGPLVRHIVVFVKFYIKRLRIP